jgi:hypothetical protein
MHLYLQFCKTGMWVKRKSVNNNQHLNSKIDDDKRFENQLKKN